MTLVILVDLRLTVARFLQIEANLFLSFDKKTYHIEKLSPKPNPKPGAVLVLLSKSTVPAQAPAPGIVLSMSRVTLTSNAKLLVLPSLL